MVAVIAALVAAYRLHHDRALWSADGPIYLRMALEDRGLNPAAALAVTDRYVLAGTSEAKNPDSQGFYGPTPPEHYRTQAALFVTRPLYPAVAALLLPRFGPFALKIVSAVAYALVTLVFFVLLLRFVTPPIAAIGGLALLFSPEIESIAALPLTDMLALLFWIVALLALIAYVDRPAIATLAAFAVATALLAITRPAVYLPFFAAVGAFAALPRASAARGAALKAVAAAFVVALAFGAYTLLGHGPGLIEQLRWEYAWQQTLHERFASHGLAVWWLLSVLVASVQDVAIGIYKDNLLLLLALAVLGAMRARRSPFFGIALGCVAGALVAVLVHPLDTIRTVTIPLTPIAIVFAAIALQELARAADADGRILAEEDFDARGGSTT